MILKHCCGEKTALDEELTAHKWHCPKCDKHLTSLLLCPECGARYTESDVWETLYNETAKELNEANWKLRGIEQILNRKV